MLHSNSGHVWEVNFAWKVCIKTLSDKVSSPFMFCCDSSDSPAHAKCFFECWSTVFCPCLCCAVHSIQKQFATQYQKSRHRLRKHPNTSGETIWCTRPWTSAYVRGWLLHWRLATKPKFLFPWNTMIGYSAVSSATYRCNNILAGTYVCMQCMHVCVRWCTCVHVCVYTVSPLLIWHSHSLS